MALNCILYQIDWNMFRIWKIKTIVNIIEFPLSIKGIFTWFANVLQNWNFAEKNVANFADFCVTINVILKKFKFLQFKFNSADEDSSLQKCFV